MNNNFDFDFDSKRYAILMAVICVVFTIIVIKAFEYLPEMKNDNTQQMLPTINSQKYNVPNLTQNSTVVEPRQEEKPAKKTLNISLPKYRDEIELDEVEVPKRFELDAPPTQLGNAEQQKEVRVEIPKEERYAQSLQQARTFKKNAKYVEALDEYKNVLSLTADKNEIAQAYEEIAEIYAISKRYGTALSYAVKSYNMVPTSNREMLLARLYYKTGDINKATNRVNNILQRDFSNDR